MAVVDEIGKTALGYRCFLLGLRLLLTWAAVWPLVMGGIIVVEWLAPGLPFTLSTLIMTGGMVPAIALVIVPLVNRAMGWIDRPSSNV